MREGEEDNFDYFDHYSEHKIELDGQVPAHWLQLITRVKIRQMHYVLNTTILPCLQMLAVLLGCSNSAAAQDRILGPHSFTERPTNSEINILRLEDAGNFAKKESADGRVIILIGRLGSGEQSIELNKRRLHNIREFLTDYVPARLIVTARGDKVEGYGRVEIYIGGKFVDSMLAERNKDLLADCCEGNKRFYPDKGRMVRHR